VAKDSGFRVTVVDDRSLTPTGNASGGAEVIAEDFDQRWPSLPYGSAYIVIVTRGIATHAHFALGVQTKARYVGMIARSGRRSNFS